MKSISIVIPVHRGREFSFGILINNLIKAINCSKDLFEFDVALVIDNAVIPPAVIEKLNGYKVYLVSANGFNSPSRMRNLGASSGRGGWVCFIDSDVVIDSDYFQRFYNGLKNNDVAIVPRLEESDRTSTWGSLDHYHETYTLRKYIGNCGDMNILMGHNFFILREVFDISGGFDQDFCSAEDRELGIRLRNMGYTIRHNPQIVCYHEYPSRLSDVIRRKWWHGKGCAKLYRLHRFTRKSLLEWVKYFVHPPLYARAKFYDIIYRCTAKVAFLISVLNN